MKRVTCYGTGLIGSAWGANFLMKGCRVTFYDVDQQRLEAARENVKKIFAFFKANGIMSEEQGIAIQQAASYTADTAEAVKEAEFIQENGPENLELKRQILHTIEEHCPADAIIASSTSGLLISDIAAGALHPERMLGGHPYNPVYIMPLVELARGEKTSQETIDTAKEFYTQMGKEPVVLNKECPGFICNRIQMAVNREAYDLVYRGVCSVEDVDKAIVFGVGLRWAIIGPHLVNHLGGGKGGFRCIFNHLYDSTAMWLRDMAKWTATPREYVPIAEDGIAEEMARRVPGTGQTGEELGAYLNRGIMQLLRFHNKL